MVSGERFPLPRLQGLGEPPSPLLFYIMGNRGPAEREGGVQGHMAWPGLSEPFAKA